MDRVRKIIANFVNIHVFWCVLVLFSFLAVYSPDLYYPNGEINVFPVLFSFFSAFPSGKSAVVVLSCTLVSV